eukprot:6900457-Pyramimonas_sp.AAC.1
MGHNISEERSLETAHCSGRPRPLAGPHDERIRNLLITARALRMQIVIMGPPGYFWKLVPIQEALPSLKPREILMRL